MYLHHVQNAALMYKFLSAYTVIEFLLFATFMTLILKSKIIKLLIFLVALAFIVVAVIAYLKYSDADFDSLSASLESILVIVICLFFFFDQLNRPEPQLLYTNANFWFTIGFMIYLSGNFFLFLQAEVLSEKTRDNYWAINSICNILKNICFAIAFYIRKNDTNISNLDIPYPEMHEKSPYKHPNP